MKYKTSLCISALCFLIAFLTTLADRTTGEEALTFRIAPGTLRLHILTENNSAQDQAPKLGLKELVLGYVHSQASDSFSKKELVTRSEDNEASIETISKEWLSDQGSDRPMTLEVTQDYFPTKAYGDMVLLRGTYDAVRITIGSGKEHNQWCVLYPSLCYTDLTRTVVPDSSKQTLVCLPDEDDYRSLLAQGDKDGKKPEVRVRFRFLDLPQ